MAGSECVHCNGFGICDLFLRSKSNPQAREDRVRCEENHRTERELMARKHRTFTEQEREHL